MATNKTWIIYRADGLSAHGWEERKLLPAGGLTSILAEEHDYSNSMPVVGERVREYTNLADPGNGVTHGKDGDWVVAEVQQFNSPDTGTRIVVCVCSYQPIEAQWQELRRGAPITAESLAAVAT